MRALLQLVVMAGPMLVGSACGRPTLYPSEPPPAYGGALEWWVCSDWGRSLDLPPDGTFEVVNAYTSAVEVYFVGFDRCESQLVATLEVGDSHTQDATEGSAWGVIDPELSLVLANFRWQGGDPAVVEVE